MRGSNRTGFNYGDREVRTASNLNGHCPLHIQGFREDRFITWPGASSVDDIIRRTPAGESPVGGVGPDGIGGYYSLITPNALREARAHFACPQMAGVLLREGDFLSAHLSARHYRVSTRFFRRTSTVAHVCDVGWQAGVRARWPLFEIWGLCVCQCMHVVGISLRIRFLLHVCVGSCFGTYPAASALVILEPKDQHLFRLRAIASDHTRRWLSRGPQHHQDAPFI